MELVLGIDLGTTNFKACVFGRDGRQRGLGRVAVRPDVSGDRCELPAERFWAHLREAVAAALKEAGAADGELSDIKAIGYSSQASSFILLDEHDVPLTPLILWPDKRVRRIDPALAALWSRPDFTDTTGLGLQPGAEFTPAKLLWFRSRHHEVWARMRRIMTISDYLVYSLTGRAVGDAGTAALLGMQDVRRLAWWPAALEAIGVEPGQLSQPLRPGSLAGPITPKGAAILGVPVGVPLAVGSLDHHAAAIGAGLDMLGEASESTGTVTACIRHADRCNPRPACTIGPGLREGQYYELVFDENGAGVLDWYQREHAPDLGIPELLRLAEKSPGAGGPVALPQADRYPGLDGFGGRSPSHGHGYYVRAILESTARTLGELLERLCPGRRPARIVATGGGARSDFWLQVHADGVRAEMVAVASEEPACLGAALMAAVVAGWFTDHAAAAACWVRARKVISPR